MAARCEEAATLEYQIPRSMKLCVCHGGGGREQRNWCTTRQAICLREKTAVELSVSNERQGKEPLGNSSGISRAS